MVERGDFVAVSSEEYTPWWVVSHRIGSTEAYRIIKQLDAPEKTLRDGPILGTEYSVLLRGIDHDRAILVPSSEVHPSPKSAWFLSGRESLARSTSGDSEDLPPRDR